MNILFEKPLFHVFRLKNSYREKINLIIMVKIIAHQKEKWKMKMTRNNAIKKKDLESKLLFI